MSQQGQYRVSRTSIVVHTPVMEELKRLKAEHHGATFDELLLHLVLEHDIAQDRRKKVGRGENMAKRLIGTGDGMKVVTSRGAFKVPRDEWESMQRERGPVDPDAEIERMFPDEWLRRGIGLGLVKLHAHLGRPKGAKDLSPRKPPQRKLALVNSKGD